MAFLYLFAFQDIKMLATIVYTLIIVATILFIIRQKNDPVKALAWITVIALLPVAGLILYIVFGRNHRKEKIFNLKELDDLQQFEVLSREQLKVISNPDPLLLRPSIADNKDIITLLLNNNK